MNRHRRDELFKARHHLGVAIDIIERVADQEQDALDNIPENLQYSSRYEQMEDAISTMEDICADLESAVSRLETVGK